MVGCVFVLGHFYYGDLTFYHHHLYLLTNVLQLELGPDLQLRGRMEELFKNAMLLSFLVACVDLNYSWFIPNLLFEKVVIDWSFPNGTGSRNNDNNNDNDDSESSEGLFGAEESKYRKEK